MEITKVPYAERLLELVMAAPRRTDSRPACWDTRVAHRNSPEAVVLMLEGWEVNNCDTLPTVNEQGKTVLQQIIHFKKLVPRSDLLTRGREMIAEIEALDAMKVAAEAEANKKPGCSGIIDPNTGLPAGVTPPMFPPRR